MKFFHQLWRPGGWVRAPVQNCRYGLAETVNFTAVCACFFVAAKVFAKLKAGPVPDTSTKIFVVWKSLGWIHSRVPIQNSCASPCQVSRKLMPRALCNSHRVPADTWEAVSPPRCVRFVICTRWFPQARASWNNVSSKTARVC